ncbi:galectin 17 [Poeciliopsis prolifica]|uniref:galectin 17 n=1 Tax=Poeciliopsis prolifica TaxID=188132 RepID=UPI0024131851|nr:galectin 17 [Poeciliopsis prolifica]
MGIHQKQLWSFIFLQGFLTGNLVDSSALPSVANPVPVLTEVGNQVVLPCSWKDSQKEVSASGCHIQWMTPPYTVFEQLGEDRWQAAEYEGRVEVPLEKLNSGDCSLIIKDVQISDTGRYESFIVVDGVRSQKSRVFIQSVKLSVTDHKSQKSLYQGDDLVLNLYTPHSYAVVFQSRNSSEWVNLWKRGDENNERIEKHHQLEQLTIKNLQYFDEGIYKVLDQDDLSVSTIKLSIKENSPSSRIQEKREQILIDAAATSSCSALLLSVLLLCSHIIYLH